VIDGVVRRVDLSRKHAIDAYTLAEQHDRNPRSIRGYVQGLTRLADASGGVSLGSIGGALVTALDPDRQDAAACQMFHLGIIATPDEAQIDKGPQHHDRTEQRYCVAPFVSWRARAHVQTSWAIGVVLTRLYRGLVFR
jgi:hypothetical protein